MNNVSINPPLTSPSRLFKEQFETFAHYSPVKNESHLERYTEEVIRLVNLVLQTLQHDPSDPYRECFTKIDLTNEISKLNSLKETNQLNKAKIDSVFKRIHSFYTKVSSPPIIALPPQPLLFEVIWDESTIRFYKNTPIQCSLITDCIEQDSYTSEELDLRNRKKVHLSQFKETFPHIENPNKACKNFSQFLKNPTIIATFDVDQLIEIWTLSHFFDAIDGISLCNHELEKKTEH